jgi:predicted NodU family carbamoyl transferase
MNHQDSHAAVAFYDSPFFDPLIVSHDGGGVHGTHLDLLLASVVDEAPIAPLTMFLSLLTR